MISGLLGRLHRFGPSRIHLFCGGVEYELFVPLHLFSYLQAEADRDAEHFFYIYHHFTAEEQRLYAFRDAEERDFFIAIQSIKGFGCSLALSILSHLSPADLLDCCERSDVTTLCRIPRIGKTTAESLIFEVNRRRKRYLKLLGPKDKGASSESQVESRFASRLFEEELAFQALLQLGYKEAQIRKELEAILTELRRSGEVLPTAADLIGSALRRL